MNDLWPRIAAVVRRLIEIQRSLNNSAAKLRGLQARPPLGQLLGYFTTDSSSGDTYTVTAYGACGSVLPMSSADVYVAMPIYNPTLGYATIVPYLMGQTNGVGVLEFVFDNTYDYSPGALLQDVSNNPLLPYIVVGKFTYSTGNSIFYTFDGVSTVTGSCPLLPGVFDYTVIDYPATDYSMEPAVYITSTVGGVSASIQSNTHLNLNVIFGGTGYNAYTGLTFDGGYDTGLKATPDIGKIAGATITAGGIGYHTGQIFIPVAGGHAATIRGTISNGGVPSWTIDDTGVGYGAIPTIAVGPPTVVFGQRLPSLRPVIVGGSLSAVIVDDPGFNTPPDTIHGGTMSATISGGRGFGAQLTATVSAGAAVSGSITAQGYGYLLSPGGTVPLSGGGSGIGITWGNDSSIARVEKTRKPDVYGCMGTNNFPMKLTGTLSSYYGTLDLGDKHYQYALGDVMDSNNPGGTEVTSYYPILWCWHRGGFVRFTVTFSGGILTTVTIIDGGYGNVGVTLVVDLNLDSFYGGQLGVSHSGTHTAIFHFTFTGGTATGYVIDDAGAGYTNVTSPEMITRPAQFGEWELTCLVQTDVDSGTHDIWPGSEIYGAPSSIPHLILDPNTYKQTAPSILFQSFTIVRRRPSSYTGSFPVTATYDFTGTFVDNIVFQGDPLTVSRIVTYTET